jgi:hypothetical protein
MRILMLESHAGVGDDAVAMLTEVGHTIERCEAGDRRFPCRGLAGEDVCPLDEYVDVAVLAQEPGVDYLEHGAVCAARERVPVVEIEPAHAHLRLPASVWTSAAGPSLAEECERAARDGTAHAQAVAKRLVALGVIARDQLEGEDATLSIAVERGTNRLLMTIGLGDQNRDRRTEIVRAATQALRDFDQRVPVIDIVIQNTVNACQR